MYMEIIHWILAVISIIGVILNIKRKPSGFIFYSVSNIGWVIINIQYKIYAQAFLFCVFTILSIWGWFSWKFGKKDLT